MQIPRTPMSTSIVHVHVFHHPAVEFLAYLNQRVYSIQVTVLTIPQGPVIPVGQGFTLRERDGLWKVDHPGSSITHFIKHKQDWTSNYLDQKKKGWYLLLNTIKVHWQKHEHCISNSKYTHTWTKNNCEKTCGLWK